MVTTPENQFPRGILTHQDRFLLLLPKAEKPGYKQAVFFSKESDTLTYNTANSSTNIDTNKIGLLHNDDILFLGKF